MIDGVEVQVVVMIGDGACMFRAISHHVHGTQDRHGEVRSELVNYVVANWDMMHLATNNVNGEPYDTVEEYQGDMLRSSTYGSACEVYAASQVYNITFEVYDNVKLLDRYGTSDIVRRLRYSRHGGGHYDVYQTVQEDTNKKRPRPLSLDVTSYETEESNVLREGTPDDMPTVSTTNNISKKSGRPPKKHRGRPKVSQLTAEEQHREAASRYNARNSEVHRAAVTKYSMKKPEVNQRAVRKYFILNRAKRRDSLLKFRTNNPAAGARAVRINKLLKKANKNLLKGAVDAIKNKYRKLAKKSSIEFKSDKEFILLNLEIRLRKRSVGTGRIEAEKMLKWCLQSRKKYTSHFERTFLSLRTFVESTLVKMTS